MSPNKLLRETENWYIKTEKIFEDSLDCKVHN